MNTQPNQIVDYSEFMSELLADLETVEALRAKVRPMLEDSTSPNYIQPGTECTCDCGRELRAHMQDILDHDDFAQRLIDGPSMGSLMAMLLGGLPFFGADEGEEGGPEVHVIVM